MISWHRIDIGDDPAATLQALLKDMDKDDRHAAWMIEECAEGTASAIKKCEKAYLRHVGFDRKEEAAKALTHWNRLQRDLKILACLRMIVVERIAKNFAEGVAEMFRNERKEAKVVKKK